MFALQKEEEYLQIEKEINPLLGDDALVGDITLSKLFSVLYHIIH